MILSVEELRKYVNTDIEDELLEAELQAVELQIRNRTNNNFQNRAYRKAADIVSGLFFVDDPLVPYKVGDTVQICSSKWNSGLYTIASVESDTFTVKEDVIDESNVLVLKVEYPMDVKMGVVKIMKWKLKNEAANDGDITKKEIQSETISRHSVTYVQDSSESDIDSDFGVPKKYLAFLKAYRKARF